ncbi:MAG: glycosyltransferase [Nostoc sp.]|uniref:glycosyltransferase family protein n=1 Tax=Nostoc sp. TaxID=1180 RepID=UPI002FF87001
MDKVIKPRLVFFQWDNKSLSKFVLLHRQQHINCLSEFFEIIVIHENCDYQEICEKYQPDLTLFESGVNYRGCQRLEIKNTNAYSEIPKLGFHNGDSWCEARAGFISDMENWGIETFFTICTTTAEHTPEIADNLFVWPNFIDIETYRDYGESKIIPVLFSGYTHNLYPWRRQIYKTVSQYYPSLVCPHLGYDQRFTRRMLYGEQYARTINASYFVPTCGTIEKEIVRKHFEIPACKSCLITEKTASIEASGFIDMQNCIFADENDVLDKIDYLFQNPEELEMIINAGYDLVHSRHTLKQRDQIFQWFNLYQNLKPNQKIIQTDPFKPLSIVEQLSGINNSHIIGNGLIINLLRQGDEKMSACKYEEAEGSYLKCVNYINWMPEPKLRLAICNLYKGDSETALYWITQPIKYILEEYQASDPDPVEWAYFIISLLCHGKLNDAIKTAHQFPCLFHPILNRTRWAIHLLNDRENNDTLPDLDKSKYRSSVHQLPDQSLDDWINHLCIMLASCQQFVLEKKLKTLSSSKNKFKIQNVNNNLNNQKTRFTKYYLQYPRLNTKEWIQSKIKPIAAQCLHYLESIFGEFLPYKLSKIKYDEFFLAIRIIATSDNVKSALLIGASNGEAETEALLAGIRENINRPTLFCISVLSTTKHYYDDGYIKCNEISSISNEINNNLKKIKKENKIDIFDLVLINSYQSQIGIKLEELLGAEFIILKDINTFENYKNYHRVLANENYTLVSHNPSHRNGYAIFQKSNNHGQALIERISLHM